MVNHKKTIKIGMGALGLLSFLASFANYMDGNFSATFWSAGYGFLGIGLALAYDDHAIPIDGTEDPNRKVSRGQKLLTYLALILGGTACLVWYVSKFMEIL